MLLWHGLNSILKSYDQSKTRTVSTDSLVLPFRLLHCIVRGHLHHHYHHECLLIAIANLKALAYLISAHRVCSNTHLTVDLYHTNQTTVHYQATDDLLYSSTVYTLISSAHEAVLVDTPTLATDATALASWIATTRPGKKLKYIYITHAHIDHFNTFSKILAKFPEAPVVTTKGVIARLPLQYEDPLWADMWKTLFLGIEKADLSLVQPLLEDGKFYLEKRNHEFQSFSVGRGDTAESTVLHVDGWSRPLGWNA
jgi:hypothetical protein